MFLSETTMANLQAQERFDSNGDPGSVGLKWENWKRALAIYLEAANTEDSRKKKAILLHTGGLGVQEIFYNLPGANITDTDISATDAYESAADQYFSPKYSRLYERL